MSDRSWQGVPYYTIGEQYHRRFGEKTYKIPVSVVDDCPNRRGLKGMQTCVFCDPWGSAAREETLLMPLRQQIEDIHALIDRKHKAGRYLVYFQAYTNTFTKVTALRANFETALSYPFVRGFIVGTRPDCLSPAVLNLWQEFHEKSFVGVELGVQSFFDDHLEFLRRGHSAEDSIKAIHKIAETTNVDLGIHLIFGNPGETDAHIERTAKICNDLPITNVKLHNLHVLKQTPLADFYANGSFTPIDLETYAHRVGLFLSRLSPRIAVHRLAAYSSRRDELIAPEWTADKMRAHQFVIDRMLEKRHFQGCQFTAGSKDELHLQQLLAARSSKEGALS